MIRKRKNIVIGENRKRRHIVPIGIIEVLLCKIAINVDLYLMTI